MFSQIQSPFEKIDGSPMESNYYYLTCEKPSSRWVWWVGIIFILTLVLGLVIWDKRRLLKEQIIEDSVMLEEGI